MIPALFRKAGFAKYQYEKGNATARHRSFLNACNNPLQTGSKYDTASGSRAGAGSGSSAVSASPDSTTRCYAYASNKDTIRMKLIQTGQDITGKLNYGLGGKDASMGTINGIMLGDTLVANYAYKFLELLFYKKTIGCG